jgi:hypothetical protein
MSPKFSLVQVFPHADCFAVFVVKFGIGDKAVLFVKSKYAFIVFYIRVNGQKTGGTVGCVTSPRKPSRASDHKCSNALVLFRKIAINRQFCYLHGWNCFEGIVEVMEFLFGERQFYRVHDERHIGGGFSGSPLGKEPSEGNMVIKGT